MSQDELNEIIEDLERENHSLTVACNDAANDGDQETADLVQHAATSLDAAISHLKRFQRRRAKF